MANSYTVSPNIIPGNVTIGGNLNVQGDELKIGLVAPFVRLAKTVPTVGSFSVNVQKDLLTRDNPAIPGYALNFDTAVPRMGHRFISAAGVLQQMARRLILVSGSASVQGTGAGGDLGVISHGIVGSLLDPNSILMVRLWGRATTVASGGLAFNFNFGGSAFPVVTVAPSIDAPFTITFIFGMNNAPNSQTLRAYPTGVGVTAPLTGNFVAVDTTVTQNLAGSVHFTLPADAVTVALWEVSVLNSWGPV